MADSLLGGIVINEILADPNGSTYNFDTDGDGTARSTDEYIELYNAGSTAIDIFGLQLWDSGAGNWFTFPAGSVLEPGAHALVITGVQAGGSLPTGGPDDLFFDAGRGAPLINNSGDNVTLYDPTNNEFIQATYNGDSLDDPTAGNNGYAGFPETATRVGAGEDFSTDVDGQSVQRSPDGTDSFTTDTPTPGASNICFANGTELLTPEGPRRVEDLRPGDLVMTLDHGPQPLRWVFGKNWSAAQIAANPNLAPLRIARGSFGPDLPARDLRLSRQHRIMVHGPIAQRMFAASEILLPAKDLLDLPGVSVEPEPGRVSYYHLMLDRHEILLANGLPCESLFMGAEARQSLPPAQLQEALALLGLTEADLLDPQRAPNPARHLVSGTRARKLIARHVKNGQPLTARP